MKLDHAALDREYTRRANVVLKSLAGLKGVTASITVPEVANHVPHVRVSWDAAARGITPAQVATALREGDPSIETRSEGRGIVVGVWMMRQGEDKIVARRLRQVLSAPATVTAQKADRR